MPTYQTALSTEVQATTTLPAPVLDSVTANTSTIDVAWTATHTNGQTRVEFRDAGVTGWTADQTISNTTESATITGLDNGTTYDVRVVATTPDVDSPSNVLTDTTTLPNEDQPVLGNGVKDEVAVDRETAVTNAGDVRYQIRESDDAPDWETADSFQQFIGAFDTLTFAFVGLLDGEQYDVRGRTETADVTGAWTESVSITTKFPGFQNFRVDAVTESSVTVAWEDFADNETQTVLERRADINGSFGPWDTIKTFDPTSGESTTLTYDDAVPPGTTVQYRIEVFSPYVSVQSDPLTATTDGESSRNVAADGYHVEIVHPDTGRVRVPEVADLQNAPVVNPGPNQQPRARIPVRKNDVWLSDAYDDDPEMRVWRDGRRLPIEVLRNVEQTEGATILIGVGGVELEQRVTEEFSDARRHEAAESLLQDATDYAAETPEPETPTLTDQVQQSPSTNAEFEAVRDFPDDGLVTLDGDTVEGVQVAYTTDQNTGNDTSQALTSDDYSGGEARSMQDTGDTIEYQFTPDHDIPQDEIVIQVREDDGEAAGLSSGAVAWTAYLNGFGISGDNELGAEIASFTNTGGNINLNWTDIAEQYNDFTPIGDVIETDLTAAATYTLTFECDDGGDLDDAYAVDVVAPYDGRAELGLDFPNTLNSPGGALDGPGHYVAQDAVFDDAVSAFNIVAGAADVTMPDTSGQQRIQVRNDRGDTYLPNDGSESNTTSVDVDFPSPGSRIRLRVTLDGYEPSGVRSTTPARNYATQTLDAYELRADVSQELLLIDEPIDTSLADALTSIAEPAERSWRFAYDDGTPTVRFVQNGQFNADYTPDYSERTREKLGKTYQRVTVKGSNEPVSNEPYTASTTFQPLVRNNILTGSETVYDDTQNYERGDDYEMRYRDGEIRALPAGDLVAGDDYRIDYRYQAEGTYTVQNASADPPELVETMPGVTSERLAEQVAYVLATETDTPRYAAEVVIPDPDPRFDPTDALPPVALGLPSGIDSLEVRGEPQLTETGLAVRFGTRPPVEATQERLSRQLGRVSDRS